jgi:hypothetical protein
MHQRLVAELRRSLLLIILNKGCDRGRKSHGSPWDTSSWWHMTWEGTYGSRATIGVALGNAEAAASQSVEGRMGNRQTRRMPTGKGSIESGRPGTGSDQSRTESGRSGTYGDIPAGTAVTVATTECAAVKGPSLIDTRMGSSFGPGVEVPAAAAAHSRMSLRLGFGVSGSEVCVPMASCPSSPGEAKNWIPPQDRTRGEKMDGNPQERLPVRQIGLTSCGTCTHFISRKPACTAGSIAACIRSAFVHCGRL